MATIAGIACRLLLMAIPIASCSEQAALDGAVYDNFGQPAEGVDVVLKNSALATKTNSEGRYNLRYIPGSFNVSFNKSGFLGAERHFEIAKEAKFPVENISLVKVPPGPGVWAQIDNGYVAVSGCKIGFRNDGGLITHSVDFVNGGQVTKLQANGPKTTFLDFTLYGGKLPELYYTSLNEVVFFKIKLQGLSAPIITLLESHPPTNVLLKSPFYMFSINNVPGRYVQRFNTESGVERDPCFVFEILPP